MNQLFGNEDLRCSEWVLVVCQWGLAMVSRSVPCHGVEGVRYHMPVEIYMRFCGLSQCQWSLYVLVIS